MRTRMERLGYEWLFQLWLGQRLPEDTVLERILTERAGVFEYRYERRVAPVCVHCREYERTI